MIGAIAGDIIGSCYEGRPIKTTEFPLFSERSRFTDDTVLTVAVADWILNGGSLVDLFHEYFAAYPRAGYGGSFILWAAHQRRQPYNSWGNGSAMRVSPVAWAVESLPEVLELAKRSAEVTHNHPEGIRGAQATAAAVFLARKGRGKPEIKDTIERTFGYGLGEPLEDIRATYGPHISCQGSVPQSIVCFLDSEGFESAVRNAVSLGGDADTMACIAGAIAEAYYGGVPSEIETKVFKLLDERLSESVRAFRHRYLDCG
jgi:ADP-ribosylglycohydrolase